MDRIPGVQDAMNYSVNRLGEAEGIRQSLYDFNLYPLLGSLQLNFFQQPQGAGVTTAAGAAVGGTKTIFDTNMEAAGSLPNPKSFLVESIEIVLHPGASAAANTFTQQPPYDSIVVAPTDLLPLSAGAVSDVHNVLSTGHLQFFIGSKSYLDEAPLHRFPPKSYFGIDGSISTAAVAAAATQTVAVTAGRAMGRPYYLDPPIFLTPTQNFNLRVDWAALVPTISGFNGRIGVILDGFLYRASQ